MVICSRILGPLDGLSWERAYEWFWSGGTFCWPGSDLGEGGGLVQEITGVPGTDSGFVDLAGMLPGTSGRSLLKRVAAATQACLDPSGTFRRGGFTCSGPPRPRTSCCSWCTTFSWASSLRTIARELSLAYQAAGGESVVFPELPIRFADYAVWRHQQSSSPDLGVHEAYWRDQLRVLAGPIPLPVDRSPGRSRTGLGASRKFRFPGTWERVEALARRDPCDAAVPRAAVRLAGVACGATQSRDVVVAHGRPTELAEVESLVGLF